MTDKQIQILSIMLNDVPVIDPDPATLAELETLRSFGYVYSDIIGDWYIKPAGVAAMSSAKEAKQEKAQQQEVQNRKQAQEDAKAGRNRKKQHLNDLHVAAFTVALTFAVDHMRSIFDYVKDFIIALFDFLK